MAVPSRERRLIGNVWQYVTAEENGGGGGGVEEITSDDNSVTITDPTGPTVDLSASGGSQPGAFGSKEFLFTETAVAGVYEGTLAMAAGGAVFDIGAFGLAGPWLVDADPTDGTEAVLDVFDSDGSFLYQQSLVAPTLGGGEGALSKVFDSTPPFDVADKGGTDHTQVPSGYVWASMLQGWTQPTGGTGDYAFETYGYNNDAAEAPVPGPLRRYADADTVTARVTTTSTVASPVGVLLVKILYFAAQTPADAVFTATP